MPYGRDWYYGEGFEHYPDCLREDDEVPNPMDGLLWTLQVVTGYRLVVWIRRAMRRRAESRRMIELFQSRH